MFSVYFQTKFHIRSRVLNWTLLSNYKLIENVVLLFYILHSRFRASWLYINKIQSDATACRSLFTAKLLYMFRVSIAPIIRSTSNCDCSFWYRS